MELQQLRGFYAVAKYKSFTVAAKKTFRAQPTVSLQIKALEDELGVKLFQRASHNQVQLTTEGEVLFELCGPLLSDFDNLKGRFEERCGNAEVAQVTMVTHRSVMSYFLPKAIKKFKVKYPDCHLSILSGSTRKDVANIVLSGEADFGITSLSSVPEELNYEPFSLYNRILIAHKGHPLSRKKSITLKDIAEFPLILPRPGSNTRKIIDDVFSREGLAYKLSMEVVGRQAIKTYVGMDFGISIMNEYYVNEEDKKKLFVKDLSKYFGQAETGVVSRRNKDVSLAAREFLGIMLAEHGE